jgi:hypothetical protein
MGPKEQIPYQAAEGIVYACHPLNSFCFCTLEGAA